MREPEGEGAMCAPEGKERYVSLNGRSDAGPERKERCVDRRIRGCIRE